MITTPSSRYDAAGVVGIINKILKKNEKTGFNGQANVSVGTRDKYNAGVNLNYGTGSINYYTSYNYQNRRQFRESVVFRENRMGNSSPFLDQDAYGERVDLTHLFRGGLDYTVSENKTFGFYMQGNFREREGLNNLNQRSLTTFRNLDSLFVRHQNDTRESFNTEAAVNYDWKIDTLGQRLFTSLSYSWDERTQLENYEQLFYNESMEAVPENNLIQRNTVPQWSDLYVFQPDFIKPFANGGSLESGLKGTYSIWDRGQEFAQGDLKNNFNPAPIDTLTDNSIFKEDVYAAYVSYGHRVGKLDTKAGFGLNIQKP